VIDRCTNPASIEFVHPFGWYKVFGGLRKLMQIGSPDVSAWTL
jgi:hypothetical protein